MPMFDRPSSFSPGPGSDLPTAAGGLTSHAGIESQLTAPADIAKAHSFFQAPVLDASAVPGLTPGLEHLAAVPPLPGVNEPISPIIQLIMRLPGHLGIMSSFFEALSKFFTPDMSLLGALDPTFLAHQAQEAFHSLSSALSEHIPIDPSLLPADAPIFHTTGAELLAGGHGQVAADAAGRQLALSGGEHLAGNPLNCSGQYDLAKPHFESASGGLHAFEAGSGGLVSGPQLSGATPGNYLAGEHRLFSDKIAGAQANSLTASSSGTLQSLPSSLNVGSTVFGQQVGSLPARAADLSSRIGSGAAQQSSLAGDGASAVGPSGAVSSRLGGQQLLASDSGATAVSRVDTVSNTQASAECVGLKARPLSLSGLNSQHSVAEQLSHKSGVVSPAARVDSMRHTVQLKTVPTHSSSSLNHAGSSHNLPEHSKVAETAAGSSNAPGADSAAHTYTIRQGDCLWNIARNHGMRWQDIYQTNTDILGNNPNLIHQGVEIKLPGSDLSSQTAGAVQHVVKPGDSLYKIAQTYLGDGNKWGQIYHLNQGVVGADPRLLHPGQELSLSGQCSQVAVPVSSSLPVSSVHSAVPAQIPAVHHQAALPTTNVSSLPATQAPSFATAQQATSPAGTEKIASSLTGSSGASLPTAETLASARLPKAGSLVSSSLRADLTSFLKGRR